LIDDNTVNAWNQHANILVLDTPGGTGFSMSKTKKSNDLAMA